MPLVDGARLGPYQIVAPLGAGGMGEVYKARDTRLDRTVAIKVLPAHTAADPLFRERFEREARAVAALNHPHICTLYDIGSQEQSPGDGPVDFLVMEYLDGESLADRIAKGPLPLDHALKIAIQIAAALDVAHRAGIVHRDLKPGNVMLTKAGSGSASSPQAKLLDFGLAKATTSVVTGAAPSVLATTPPNLTAQGTLLGTFQYMAPEQLEGQEADPRTDIFAFGCVLYEMLTGRKAFEGRTHASLIAAIMHVEPPPISTAQAVAPRALDRLVRKCLAKDADNRWQTARDLLDELQWQVAESGRAVDLDATGNLGGRSQSRFRLLVPALLVVAILGGGGAVAWLWRAPQPMPGRPVRLPIDTVGLAPTSEFRNIVMSPDGAYVVYISYPPGNQNSSLWVREVGQLEAREITGLKNPREPFVSPDSKWIGFSSQGVLEKVSVAGGPSTQITRIPGGVAAYATWGTNGTIVFTTNNPLSGLWSTSAGGGGELTSLTKPDRSKGEDDHQFPSFLSNNTVLFTVTPFRGAGDPRVEVLNLETNERKILLPRAMQAEYVETVADSEKRGYLLSSSAGTLRAVRFDPARLEVIGDAVPVLDHVLTRQNGTAEFSVSGQGAVAYIRGGVQLPRKAAVVWVTPDGHEEPIAAQPGPYAIPRLSPDGTRIAVGVENGGISVFDFDHKTMTPLSGTMATDGNPVWTPNSRRIVFNSNRSGISNLYWQSVEAAGDPERLSTSQNPQFAVSMSNDGLLLFREQAPPAALGGGSRGDLMLLHLDEAAILRAVSLSAPDVASPGGPGSRSELVKRGNDDRVQVNGEISPDSRWLAYASNEEGQKYQIYVSPFPNVNDGLWKISTRTGTKPAWRRDGRELLYVDADSNLLMSAAVPAQTSTRFIYETPRQVLSQPYFRSGPGTPGRTDDVAKDNRFLMIKDAPASEQTSEGGPAPRIVVVLNWLEEWRAKVGK